MNDPSKRSWVFVMVASVLAILAARGIGPYGLVAGLILVAGLFFKVEWFVPCLLAFWALLSVPLLVALGASEAARDRMAVLFLTLMATGLARLIAEVRGTPKPPDAREKADALSPNGKGGME